MTRQILCYGDSNTWGCVPSDGPEVPARFPRAQRWAGVLQAEVGHDYWVIEEGLNGRTTVRDDETAPYRNGLTFLLPTLETHHPLDFVVVMLGTNDLKEQFAASPAEIAQGAAEIVRTIRTSGFGPHGQSPQVVLISPPLIGRIGQFETKFADAYVKSRLLAAEFRNAAKTESCAFLDAGEYVSGSDVDGVHLDRESHSILGKAVATVVSQTMDSKEGRRQDAER